jgi:CHAD domain-containing protein
VQLGFWPDEVRGVPNAALRGALFSISQEREMAKKRQRLATVDGYQIMFKGERYNQRDLDLWEMLLHIGRQQPFGKHTEFVASDLLKALGRATGGADYEELKEDISRLMGGVVEITITDTKETFIGSLIHNAYREETTQRYAIVFDEKMRKLYDAGYTHVDWEQRRKLKDNSLAKWLHGFYSTHAAPLRYKVETIKELCGSTTGRLTDFRKALRTALDKLKAVGAITSWAIDPKSDLVTVRRKGSVSQQKHLEGKQAVKTGAEFSNNESGTFSGFDSH